MSDTTTAPLAIWYEHPDWFRPLFQELDRRGTPYVRLEANRHSFDPEEAESPHAVVFNRLSPSAWQRGNASAISYTTQYLAHQRRLGVRVINGEEAWRTEISKAAQLSLLQRLGLHFPASRVIHDPRRAPAATEGLRFPIVVKPNVGGSGAGVRRFDERAALEDAVASGSLDFGLDGTGIVQEFVPARDGRIIRVEVLDGRFLYAIRIYSTGESFNLCPADVCQRVDGEELVRGACAVDAPKNGLRVEGWTPPREIIATVEKIVVEAGIEIGGVEYMIDDRDGRVVYYDINALSNFVADAPRVVGFDAFARLADWLETEVERAVSGAPHRPAAAALDPRTASHAPNGVRIASRENDGPDVQSESYTHRRDRSEEVA